jgi:DNA polymerase III epsilon subunit-like protein
MALKPRRSAAMPEKLIYTDIETTGLVPGKHAIIQIAAIKEVDGEVVGELDLKIKPFPDAHIHPKALEVNGITEDELMSEDRIEYGEAISRFLDFSGLNGFVRPSDRAYFVGYNSSGFDFPHMQAMASYCGVDYFFAKWHWPGIDVAVLACEALRRDRTRMRRFNLEFVAQHLGLSWDGDLHDAMVDIRLTRDVHRELVRRASGEEGGWRCSGDGRLRILCCCFLYLSGLLSLRMSSPATMARTWLQGWNGLSAGSMHWTDISATCPRLRS